MPADHLQLSEMLRAVICLFISKIKKKDKMDSFYIREIAYLEALHPRCFEFKFSEFEIGTERYFVFQSKRKSPKFPSI